MVLVFRRGATNADVMTRFCGLNKKSDEAGFIAVYPNGTGRTETLLTFNGGMGEGIAKFKSYSVDHSIKAWVKAYGCVSEPVVISIP